MYLDQSDITVASKSQAKRIEIPCEDTSHVYYFNEEYSYNRHLYWLMTEKQYNSYGNNKYYAITKEEYHVLLDYWETIELETPVDVINTDIQTAKKMLTKEK